MKFFPLLSCLASHSEMTKQDRVTFPIIIKLFLSFYFGAECFKKAWISIIAAEKYPFRIINN